MIAKMVEHVDEAKTRQMRNYRFNPKFEDTMIFFARKIKTFKTVFVLLQTAIYRNFRPLSV